MASYIYKTILYTNTSDVVGLDETQNNADLSDYQTNHQSDTVKIDSLALAETSFLIDKTFADFDSLITGVFDWTDVRHLAIQNQIELYLLSANPL